MKNEKLKYLFRILALIEGLSYILLLFIAVPLKYLGNNEILVKLLGMPHGILFILYIVTCLIIYKSMEWNKQTLLFILIASVIPFGTFYIDKKYLR